MARLEYFLVAESISIDASTNRLSLFHVLEEVNPESFPCTLNRVCAVATLIGERPEHRGSTATLVVTGLSSGEPHREQIRFELDSERVRLIFDFPPLTIDEPGTIKFELQIDGQHQASHEVSVRYAPAEPIPPSGQD